MNEVAEALKKLTKTDDEVYSVVGKVTEVDEAARVCTVEPLNGDAALLDIRLQAAQEQSDGVVLIPKVGSWVVVTFTSKESGYVAERSQVDKVLWVIEGQTLEYTKAGLSLKSDQAGFAEQVEKLLDTLDGLIQTLNQFQLSTNMGPTIAVMPHIIQQLTQHKTDLKDVKTNLKTMLY